MQALVAIQLIKNVAAQLLAVQLLILTIEIFGDMAHESSALTVFHTSFHFTYGCNNLLTDGEGWTAGRERGHQKCG